MPPFDALALFAANGSFHDTNASNPGQRSSGFGYWKRTEKRTYRFAFNFFRFDDAALMPPGTTVVRHDVVLSADGRSYTSKGTSERVDIGNPVPIGGCSASTATRLQ